MTHTAIATDVHQSLDVQLNFGAEVTLDLVFSTNDLTDLGCLVVVPVLYFQVSVNAGLVRILAALLRPIPKI